MDADLKNFFGTAECFGCGQQDPEHLGARMNPDKTRIVHVRHRFEFLGYKIKYGSRPMRLEARIKSGARQGALYAYPTEKSSRRSKDRARGDGSLTKEERQVAHPRRIAREDEEIRHGLFHGGPKVRPDKQP